MIYKFSLVYLKGPYRQGSKSVWNTKKGESSQSEKGHCHQAEEEGDAIKNKEVIPSFGWANRRRM